HLTATDISAEMIAIARQKAAAQGVENVTFRPGTLEDPDLPPASFDAVLAFNLLHLVADVPAALARAAAVLKPGGVFISKSACLKRQGWYLRPLIGAMRALGRAPYVAFFTAADLDRMVAAAGFDIVEAEDIPPGAPTRFIVARKV
ncbi:MAG: class I SAM-dependent methyltransferase, partial [Azospirillaceae bacterium]